MAYGILVQLAAENRMTEVEELLELYQTLGLPRTMRELGITAQLEEAAHTVANHAARKDETFCLIGDYTKEQIVDAIQIIETYQPQKRSEHRQIKSTGIPPVLFLLKIEVIWVWTRALIFIELINDTHFMGGQLEIKYVCVFDDSALRHRFRNGDNAMLQVPAKNDLRH